MPRRAMRGVMPRARRARRRGEASSALSAWSLAGRLRGRPGFPRGPMSGGMASTSGSSCAASCTLAAERRTASGIPLRSTTRWYLESELPRSVGFGPVWCPPFGPDTEPIQARSAPVDGGLIPHPVQPRRVPSCPDSSVLPIPQPSPARGPAAAAQRPRQQAPGTTGAQNEDDASEGGTIRDARTTALGLWRLLWQQRFDGFPKVIGDKG